MPTLFGEQLKKERRKKGLTAGGLSVLWGVSRSYITLIETGKRLPGKKHISKIAIALGLKTGMVLNWNFEHISHSIQSHSDNS